MNNGERNEDKKSRISFQLILILCLVVIGYLNHGRVRPDFTPDAVLRAGWFVLAVGLIACVYVWWANRRDSK